MTDLHDILQTYAQDIILIGGAIMAIAYGIRRMYNLAKKIDTVLSLQQAQTDTLTSLVKDRLIVQDKVIEREKEVDKHMLSTAMSLEEITREIRPNGGSSIKDVVNLTNAKVSDLHARVSVLEQWKHDKNS